MVLVYKARKIIKIEKCQDYVDVKWEYQSTM